MLVDGALLASLMIDHGSGVSRYRIFELKEMDKDYFQESLER